MRKTLRISALFGLLAAAVLGLGGCHVYSAHGHVWRDRPNHPGDWSHDHDSGHHGGHGGGDWDRDRDGHHDRDWDDDSGWDRGRDWDDDDDSSDDDSGGRRWAD